VVLEGVVQEDLEVEEDLGRVVLPLAESAVVAVLVIEVDQGVVVDLEDLDVEGLEWGVE
jgi:hypothetical protein